MAVFTPFDPGTRVDTRLLVAWREGFTIDTITGSGTDTLTVTDVLNPNNLVLTYTGSTTMTASGTTPGAGTFESINVLGGGTLTGIAPAGVFGDIVNQNAYRIFDGSDTINGSTAGGDFLFAGFGGNDTLDGKGGGDFFQVSERTGFPTLTIKGASGSAKDTLFVVENIYDASAAVLDLRGSTLTGIDFITLSPGTGVTIKSSQLGAGLSATAVIGATSGAGAFDIVKDTNGGTLDVSGLIVNDNTLFKIFGSDTAETIIGSSGDETFSSGAGGDTVNGGGGNDTFILDGTKDEFDKINGGSGIDTVQTTPGAEGRGAVLNGFNAKTASIEVWSGAVSGNAGNNTFDFRGLTEGSELGAFGGDGDDTIMASSFGMTMLGEAGKDRLVGGEGEDFLFGGLGADTLTGGGEADLFIYTDVKESGQKKSLRDTITDFDKSDRILMAVDANKGKKDFQVFKFVKKEGASFKKKPGSLIWEQIDKPGSAKDMTIIYGDTNGDRKADIVIQLNGLVDLKADDFVFSFI